MKIFNVFYSLEGEQVYRNVYAYGVDRIEACRNAVSNITQGDPLANPKIIGYEEIKE
jgi:hypothetical protein